MASIMRISASCAVGTERVLSDELKHLGLPPLDKRAGRVDFMADQTALAKALVELRTADRLFLVAGVFPAGDFDQLFEGVKQLPWEQWVGRNDQLVIEKARSLRSRLSAQTSIQSISLKAAYDRLCKLYKVTRMPETGRKAIARLRLDNDQATVELDLCGEALSRRGYRKRPTEAPLKESVAAAILFMAGWRRSFPLYDPFCGSGTIPIEAALYAFDIAPGLGRNFSWETMPEGSPRDVELAKEQARSKVNMDREVLIAGSDADQAALDACLANAGLAGVGNRIRFFRARAEEAAPFSDRGFIITDPPYGKRLGTPEEADALYTSLSRFAGRFSGWEQCIVVDREDFSIFTDRKGKHSKIVDGAETRWLHRYSAG